MNQARPRIRPLASRASPRRFSTALGVLICTAGSGAAWGAPGPVEGAEIGRNVIATEPLALVFARTIALEYERGFGHVGVHLSTALALGDFSLTESERSGDYLSLGFTAGVRFYPWSEAPRGAFFGPFGTVAWIQAESRAGGETAETSGVGWAAGAMVGWTWVLGTSFVVSVGGGAAWYELALDPDAGDETSGRSGLLPALRLAVGAAF